MKRNPDKYIRAGLYQILNGMIVDGKTISVYDVNTPNNDEFAIILSTQTGSDNQRNKCYTDLNRQILIDAIHRIKGHTGSRVLVDDMIEECINRISENLQINFFTVQSKSFDYPADLTMNTATETIHRKILRLNLKLIYNG